MLKQRILAGLVMLALSLLVIYLGGHFLTGLSIILVAACSMEGFRFSTEKRGASLIQLVILTLLPAIGYLGNSWPGLAGMSLFSIFSILAITLWEIEKGEYLDNLLEIIPRQLAMFTWLAGFGTAFIVACASSQGSLVYIWLLAVVVSTDTAAYFVGRFFGKRKLAPRISPKKTIEGSLGGLLFAILAGVLLVKYASLPLSYLDVCFYSAVGSCFSQLGDLVESMFKRAYGVKDSGNSIPGHGGVLDRLDGLLFASPVIFFLPAF